MLFRSIHHVGTTADHLFYIMDPADDISGTPASCGAEYDPATLAVRLRAGPVDDHDCLNWSTQLLSALACLHQVVFQYPGLDDLEVGRIDFSKTHEIVAHWPDRNASRMKVKR